MNIINDFSDTRLDVYSRMSEPQLKRIYEPKEGLFVAESPMVIERALDAGYEPESVLTCNEAYAGHGRDVIARIEKEYPGVPVYVGSTEVLSKIRGFQLTRGVLCAMKRHALPGHKEMLKNAGRVVLLNDVENPSNIGAIIRSAAAMKMDAVLLTYDCSDPLYRRAARVSVGTVFQIPWTYISRNNADDPYSYIDGLKDMGFTVAAMALSDDSVSVSDERLKTAEKLVIVMGNEGYGLPGKLLDKCDHVVKIQMAEGVDSLNVAAASAVAFYAVTAQ